MRRTLRQLAAIKPSKYLEAGAPTGLTGLFNHPSPRSTLLYIYSQTLDKLGLFPEASLYRQSVEAVTKHRMSILSAIEPEGLAAWKEQARKIIQDNPGTFTKEHNVDGNVVSLEGKMTAETHGGNTFITKRAAKEVDELDDEWDAETAIRGGVEVGSYMKFYTGEKPVELPEEPVLTADQIGEAEHKIGAGLIEEVIQVAEGELTLVDVMLKSKVWEDLLEKPVEGQWTYFKRSS